MSPRFVSLRSLSDRPRLRPHPGSLSEERSEETKRTTPTITLEQGR